jgi:hypothetical protein
VARHVVRTPGPVTRLDLVLDEGGRAFGATGKDVAFLRAELRDANGTLVPDAWENVFFRGTGVTLVGANPFSTDAGIASIVVEHSGVRPRGGVYGLCLVRDGDQVRALTGALAIGAGFDPFEADLDDVRVTTDDRQRWEAAPRYEGPFTAAGRVRAALFVAGRPVVDADTAVPTFRIAGSTALVQSR